MGQPEVNSLCVQFSRLSISMPYEGALSQLEGNFSAFNGSFGGQGVTQWPNGSFEVAPVISKHPGRVLGEQVVRPVIDVSERVLQYSWDAAGAAFRYSWGVVTRTFSAVDSVASRIFRGLPGAYAIEETTGSAERVCEGKGVCHEMPGHAGQAVLLDGCQPQSLEPSEPLSRYTVALSELSDAIQTLHSPEDDKFSPLYRAIVRNATIDSSLARRKEENRHEAPSVVRLPEQNFVLAPLPRKEHTAAYFRLCLKENAHVLVSAHEVTDANAFEYGKFWDQSVLSQLSQSELDGWKLKIQNVSVFAVGTEKNTKGRIPQLVETTIVATHDLQPSRTMTHLHYEGWVDRTAASDEQLLLKLLDRMEALSPDARTPIAINCHAGRGRTLNIAAAYFFRKKIAFARLQGLDDSEIGINLPELIFQIHQQRDLDTRSKPPLA